MRITPIFEDQYGHIYSRGVGKQTLFHNIHEYARMLFLILYSQSEEKLRTARHVEKFMKTGGDFGVDPDVTAYIVANRMVEVLNFCIMPNHFHITLHNITEAGISQYMQRIQLSYAKYFNKRYDKSGHVFQGAYNAVPVTDDNQLDYLSAYIHKNPRELKQWRNKEEQCPWSSYGHYSTENNMDDLLVSDSILERFESGTEYCDFVKECSAKELKEEWENWR